MITSRLMFCSQGAVRDAENNTISAFNIIEDLQTGAFPLFVQQIFAVAFLQRDAADPAQVQMTLDVLLNDQVINTFPIPVNFGDKLRTRLITKINGLSIPGPGNLTMRLMHNGETLASWALNVTP